MKFILLLATTLIPSLLLAQAPVLPVKDGKVVYEHIDSSATASKEQLYYKARLWIAEQFIDYRSAIKFDDPAQGEIVGRYTFYFDYGSILTQNTRCGFTIKVSCRDNKYRIQVYDITHTSTSIDNRRDLPMEYYIKPEDTRNKNLIRMIDTSIQAFIKNLNTAMREGKAEDNF